MGVAAVPIKITSTGVEEKYTFKYIDKTVKINSILSIPTKLVSNGIVQYNFKIGLDSLL